MRVGLIVTDQRALLVRERRADDGVCGLPEGHAAYRELRAHQFLLPLGLRSGNPWFRTISADLCAVYGDRADAELLYRALTPFARANIDLGIVSAWTGSASRRLGRLATLLGEYRSARTHLEHAIEDNRRMHAAPELARSQLDLAVLLRREGETRRARVQLEEAESLASELGMRLQRWGCAQGSLYRVV